MRVEGVLLIRSMLQTLLKMRGVEYGVFVFGLVVVCRGRKKEGTIEVVLYLSSCGLGIWKNRPETPTA